MTLCWWIRLSPSTRRGSSPLGRASGKNLRAIYITHPHADHLFGLGTILATFPEASGITLADISPFMAGQVSPGFRAVWEGFFPGQLARTSRCLTPLTGRPSSSRDAGQVRQRRHE